MAQLRHLGIWTAVAAVGLSSLAFAGAAWGRQLPEPDVRPVQTLWGGETGLVKPYGIAFDDTGQMYVTNMLDRSVTVYAADWKGGNTKPIKTLKGDKTLLVMPVGIAFDAEQRMYVVNSDSVNVYPANWTDSNTAPLKSLRGGGTGLLSPRGIAFDSGGRMYVSNSFEIVGLRRGSITVYEADWPSGNTSPVAKLEGNGTGLVRPNGIAFDAEGTMYVAEDYGISAYAPGWDSGATEPTKVLAGPGTALAQPYGIAFDEAGYMYVTNAGLGGFGQPHVTVYPPGWRTGNVPPVGVIRGALSGLSGPTDLAFGEDGRLYVVNQDRESVSVYLMQSLAMDPMSNVPWTTKTVTVSASATSGLPVTLETKTPDVCEGSGTSPMTITIKAMGTCTVEATQEGDDSWSPAPDISESFSVTPASQTITVKPIGDTPLSRHWTRARATTTSGLPVTWTSTTPDICTTKRGFGQRVYLKAAGTCTLQATQAGNKLWYSAPSVTDTFTVTQ